MMQLSLDDVMQRTDEAIALVELGAGDGWMTEALTTMYHLEGRGEKSELSEQRGGFFRFSRLFRTRRQMNYLDKLKHLTQRRVWRSLLY